MIFIFDLDQYFIFKVILIFDLDHFFWKVPISGRGDCRAPPPNINDRPRPPDFEEQGKKKCQICYFLS